jgi:predicted ATPase/class 3 adenylate cyclase/DNA-binding CsgD family transcriptional regulator
MRASDTGGGLVRPLLVDAVMGEQATEVSAFAVPAGTVTFLLTDVEGSTRLWEHAPSAMPQAIARHYEILDEAIARHGGVRPVEQGEGDSVVAAFTRARDAVAAALDVQRALVAEDWPAGAELRVRMALHTGDAQLRDEGNYFGGAVNRCARLRAVAHGGQVLLSGATAELVADHLPAGAELVNLGVHRLRDLGRAERVFALGHPDLPGGVPPPRSLDQLPNNLPIQLTSFVGRGRELVELDKLLASTRLLTLTGAGGCGKTRLALQLAADALDRYPGGAWWLELAPLSDPALIESALATAVGVRPLPGQTPLEAAVSHLAADRALVLLDNCEHILEPSVRIADAVLCGCPDVTVVATSRAPLGVGGETTWRVPSLSLPPERTLEAPQSLGHSDAVGLFIERAVKVRPNFAVTNDTAPHVAQICQDLDGIPLAIELAAARVRVLSVERIAAGLGDRFRLLTGGARGALPRLQTLRASVDWSHALLDESERMLLRRLGVFQGGFTLDACEEVCADDDLDRYAVLDLLTSLVDKSLVLVEERESLSRYALLETVRHYALDRLADAGEAGRLRDRHADAFVAFAESTTRHLATNARWEDVLGADAANLYAAIDHAAEAEPDAALRLSNALGYWWWLTGRLVEGHASLTRALDATAGQRTPLRGGTLAWRGYLAIFAADLELAERDATEALALAHELGDLATEARALDVLGLIEIMPDPRGALSTLERSCELARAVGDDWCLAEATQNVGWALFLIGEYDAARAMLEDSLEIAHRHSFRDLVAWHGVMVGHTVYPSGDLDAARALWERCLDGATDTKEGVATWSLGLLDVDAGKPVQARERLELCRERMVTAGAGVVLPLLDAGIGLAHAALGRLDEARSALAAAAQEHADGFVWAQALTLLSLAHVERLRGDLAASQSCAEQALSIAERLGNRTLMARARHQLARIAAARGEWATAEQLAHEALAEQAERGDHLDAPDSLDALAEIAAGLESHQEAARLLGAADRARADLGIARWSPAQERAEALAQRMREALGEEALTATRAEGDALSLDEAIAYARRARGARKRPSGGWESLTPTELEIVRHAAAGLTNPEIGEKMFISRGTVKVHLSHIYAKLGLRNRSEVAAEAMRRQLAEHS